MRLHPRHHLLITALAAAFGATLTFYSTNSLAQTSAQTMQQVFEINIPAQGLAVALNELSRQTGVQVFAAGDLVTGMASRGISGKLTLEQALREMLAGTPLSAAKTSNGGFAIHRATDPASSGTTLPLVTITAAGGERANGPVKGYLAKRSATGTKTDTAIIETPQSISVVTAERIEAIGATTLKDALGYLPGVDIAPFGVDTRYDWISLRGFDAYTPGFYLDGLPLRNIGTWGLWQTENYGVERIELLRGPASVLYGQSGPGGVVNVVSKLPLSEPLHEIQVQAGDHSRHQVAADFSGPVDDEGKLLYRVTGLARDARLPTGNMPDNRFYVAPSLTWRPSSDTSLTLLSQYLRTNAGVYTRARPAAGSLIPTAAGTYAPISAFVGEPDYDRFSQEQWMLGYQLEHHLNDRWTVRQNARYGHFNTDLKQVSGSGFMTINPDDIADPANYRTINRSVFSSRESVTSFALDNQVQGKLQLGDWRHTFLFGLDYQHSRFDQVTTYGPAPSLDLYAPVYGQTITLSDPYIDAVSSVEQTGLYAQDQVKWNDWVATLGGRYDYATGTVDSRLDGSSMRIPDHKVTSRAGLVYLAPNGLAPYASYSQSFVPTATIDATGQPLKPETGRQYELGLRYQPPGRNDSYSAAVFDLRRQNYVTYDPNNIPKQTGEVLVRGLELEATLQPVSRMNITASYTFTPKAVVTASSNPAEIDKQLTAVSRHKASLWADYRFVSGVKVGLGARYMGSNQGNGEAAPATVPSYTVFDAIIGYDFDKWSLALNLRNLTDKTYIANCDAYANCYYGYQRTAVATATYRW